MQIGSKSCLEGKPVCPAAPYKEFFYSKSMMAHSAKHTRVIINIFAFEGF